MMDERAKTVPPPQIPLAFVAVALTVLGATLAWASIGSPAPLAILHALVVGVFLMVAMGLLYQFVPVVAMAPLRWPYAAFVHLACAVTGTACIVYGFTAGTFAVVRLGGAFELGGVALQMIVLGFTLRSRRPPAAAAGAALSLLWLVVTIALGVWVADRFARGNDAWGVPGDHALLGLAGFFGTLVTAVTLRLMRMFERVSLEERIPFLAAGASLAALLAVAESRFGGYALLAVALAVGVSVVSIARARNPAYQRETLWYGLLSSFGAIGAASAYIAGQPVMAIEFAVFAYVGTAVLGYLQRIVPFIWWIRRSRREGTRNIPTLAQMNDTRLGYAILVLWILAGGTLLFGAEHLAAGIALIAWVGLVVQLARPFVLKKRPANATAAS